jgi:hypothetical protein
MNAVLAGEVRPFFPPEPIVRKNQSLMALPANWVWLIRDFDCLHLMDFELYIREILKLTPYCCQSFLVSFEGIGLEIVVPRNEPFVKFCRNRTFKAK